MLTVASFLLAFIVFPDGKKAFTYSSKKHLYLSFGLEVNSKDISFPALWCRFIQLHFDPFWWGLSFVRR